MRAVAELPVFVARDRPGDQEIAAGFHVRKQSLPGVLVQGLRRRENHERGRAEFGDLVFGNDVRSNVQAVSKGTNCLLLRLELQICKNRELRGLRGHNGYGRLTRILKWL